MRKIISFLLIFVFVLCLFSGCSSNKIVGTWVRHYDISEKVTHALHMSYLGDGYSGEAIIPVENFNVDYCYQFYKDGTYKIYVDVDGLNNTFDKLKKSISDNIDYIIDEVKRIKSTNSSIYSSKDIGAESSHEVYNTIVSTIQNYINIDSYNSYSREGLYKLEENNLYYNDSTLEIIEDSNYDVIEITEDALIIKEIYGVKSSLYSYLCPVKLEKISK